MNNEYSIFDAAYKGDLEFVSSKLEEDPNLLHQRDSNKRMLIHWAVLSGNFKLVTHLIELGSEVNPEDDTDTTPLILASSAGHAEIVKIILTKCDDVNHKGTQGHSALQYAASKGWLKICEILLEKGADVNIADIRGSTPLHRAASKGILSIIKLLIERNDIKINFKDAYGSTPLHLACEEDREHAALFLVENGADIEAKNRDRQTPLDLCSTKLARLIKNKVDNH